MNQYEEASFLQRVEEYNSLLGYIKYQDHGSFYLMPVAWWILDYKAYDPIGSAEDNSDFRNNIFTVSDSNMNGFIEAIQADQIDTNSLKKLIKDFKEKYAGSSISLSFYIDLDKKIYVSSFSDIETEEYLPDSTWTGKFDAPTTYLPEELSALFE